ncbi:MAG TPA: asparagine synthase (glutamine-hydrolyzing) [Bacillales bacterium]|nr:asparagine synthase (glutamine-hydrolyzing) [Bacillales bacterium]
MCGITGWIDWNMDLRQEKPVVERMARTLRHRGPDDLTTWTSPCAAFGHTRLIVVDPDGGKQPMTRMDNGRSYAIVYNGELYNTEDLRKELLERGYRFRGHSDTEVLLTSYIEWGPDCLERLNGIFAFAVWNEKRHELFMARDRLGVKPLFYCEKDGRLLFGSEQKAILAHPDVRPLVDREGLSEIFGLGPSRTPGHGVYKDMDELRPAHALLYNRDGLKIWRYWDVVSEEHSDNVEETVEKVRELFQDTVKRQLVADVPIAAFLSGGLDSSAITAVAANAMRDNGKDPLNTYSIDYDENDKFFESSKFMPDPDGPWVDKVSQSLGTQHHSLIMDNLLLSKYLKDAVHARDLPGYADIDSSLLWFCGEIKKGATVGLSGECADEILGGYPWFHSPETSAEEGFPWMRSTAARQSLLNPEWQKKLKLRDYVLSRFKDTLNESPKLEGESSTDAKRRQLFYLNVHWFMAALLDRKDRMSMGASLEVRVPFADHRLVEYLWNVPWHMKMLDDREKGVFRRAMKGLLPDDVLYRKKSPYPKTFHPEYTKAVVQWFSEIVNDPASPILQLMDKKKLQEIIDTEGKAFDEPWYGQLMTGPQLIAHFAQINTWLEDYNVEIVDR